MASFCDWGCTLMARMNISGVRWTKAIHHPYYFLLWHCGPKGVRRKRSDQPISNKSFLSWDTGREWQSVKRGRHQVIVSLSSLYPVSKLIWIWQTSFQKRNWSKTNEGDPLLAMSPPMTLGSKRSETEEKRSSNIRKTPFSGNENGRVVTIPPRLNRDQRR